MLAKSIKALSQDRRPRWIKASRICILLHISKAGFNYSFDIHSKYFQVLNKVYPLVDLN